jgi:hypothetical protein
MTIINQKHKILESLDGLDYYQQKKVLDFIKALVYPSHEDVRHETLKREALKQIRLALGNGRKLGQVF